MKKLLFLSLLMLMAVECSHGQITNVFEVQDSLIRPANGAIYANNDVVNDSLSSANKLFIFNDVVATKGFGGVVTSAMLTFGDSINVVNGVFKLLIFSDSVVSVADNAAWATNFTYNPKYVGEIDFTLINNNTTMGYSFVAGNLVTFKCNPAKKKLYGVLLAKAAYTPAFRQKVIITLRGIRN